MNNTQMNTGMTHTQPNMQEKELLNDLLNTEKQILTILTTAVIESNCPELRTMLLDHIRQVSMDQFNIFNEMSTRGYYQIKPAQPQDFDTARQQASQMQGMLH